MTELLALGISYKTAPVEVRERLALTGGQAERLLQELVATSSEVHEAVAISTCNRTELHLVVGEAVEAESAVLGTLAQRAGIRPTELAEVMYSPRNCDAARHLFRVTAGLESMIVGEAEVQGQVRRAYEAAQDAGTTGPLSDRVFGAALSTGRRVRAETAIGAGAMSVSSVAAQLAQETLGPLAGRSVVIVGAGESAELTAQAMADRGVRSVFVANRRRDRAESLARRFDGETVGFDALPEALERADIVVGATSSPHPIIGEEELGLVMEARGGRPLLLIDIAVPRDVEEGCGALDGVTLHDIDDLQAVVARNRLGRRSEVHRAETIVEEEIQRFAAWLGTLEVRPTVAALRRHGDAIAEHVLAENAGRWESASERDLERVSAIAGAIVKRLLHEPTLRLKAGGHARTQLVRELFGLDGEEAVPPATTAENVHPLPRRAAGDR